MRRSVALAALALLALTGTGVAADGGDELRRYELPNSDTIELFLPAGWQDAVDQQPGGAQLTIEFRPRLGAGFEVYLTPEWNGRAPGRVQDAETLRETVRDAALRMDPAPGERPAEVRRLQGADGVGFYFVATDPAPPPDGLGHLVQGAMLAGGLVLHFEVLTRDPGDAAIGLALAMLQGAVHRAHGLDPP